MNEINTGGPAFPDPQDDWKGDKGMTLRDYFAAKAMQALIQRNGDDTAYGNDVLQGRPVLAYEYADAMLKARKA